MEKITGVHLWLVFMKAYHAMAGYATGSLRGSGLGDSDFRVLEVLLHKGPLPVNAIGPKVHLTPGSISVAVDRLHARGLVSRADSETDRRVRMVDLTPAGRALIGNVFAAHETAMEDLVQVLSETEREELAELLRKLGRHAAAAVNR
jgi:MarR family transcriptional regulator, 2-MHQ and catechol-resistance regulon repressor